MSYIEESRYKVIYEEFNKYFEAYQKVMKLKLQNNDYKERYYIIIAL